MTVLPEVGRLAEPRPSSVETARGVLDRSMAVASRARAHIARVEILLARLQRFAAPDRFTAVWRDRE
jgi:hypothetical protein